MPKLRFRSGDVIFRDGDPSDFVGMILSGEAEVLKELGGDAVVIGVAREGEFIGEMGVIEGLPRNATLRARGDLTLDLIDEEDFLKRISEDGDTALQLLSRLSERLRLTSGLLAEAKVSIEEVPSATILKTPAAVQQVEIHSGGAVTIFPESDDIAAEIPGEGLKVSTFPFLVGRARSEKKGLGSSPLVHLRLKDEQPFRLSRVHFGLQHVAEGKYTIRDFNSTLGTEVNGQFLGASFPRDCVELEAGDNRVVAGGAQSSFVFRFHVT